MNKEAKRIEVDIKAIGFFYTDEKEIPRHWTMSDVEGVICLEKEFEKAARNIRADQKIVVIFWFDRSRKFSKNDFLQIPMHQNRKMGVFSICSPVRPNPIGMSVLEVLEVNGCQIYVKGIDMLNGTPVLDIKPYIEKKSDCPSYQVGRNLC